MDCTSVVAVLLKCSTIYCLQNFVKYNSWEKLKHILKKPWGDYQNGFRDGRSVIDNILVLKITNEKIWEYNQNLQYLFIHFQKAYDFIHRDMLWKYMEEFEIPTELINMCKKCVKKTRSAVRIQGTLSSFFENKMTETG
jgi:hypothetical protein